MSVPQEHYTPELVRHQVARGMALLDECLEEGWERSIDPEHLRLETCADCVIGQLAQVSDGYDDLDPEERYGLFVWRELGISEAEACMYGFDGTRAVMGPEQWALLDAAWRSALAARLVGAPA